MITIAVTGGMGAGKSETAKLLQHLGATVINADQVAHRAYEHGTPTHDAIVKAFGTEMLADSGDIDRSRLGATVFSDPHQRCRLEAIVWPATRKLIARDLNGLRACGHDAAVLEAAVLFEAGWDDLADVVVTVEASEATRKRRIRERTGMSDADILARFAAQLPSETRVQRADYVLTNDANRADLATEVTRIWNAIRAANT